MTESTSKTPKTSQGTVEAPDSGGKFSLSEDWIATITGLVILALCLVGIIPDFGEWL